MNQKWLMNIPRIIITVLSCSRLDFKNIKIHDFLPTCNYTNSNLQLICYWNNQSTITFFVKQSFMLIKIDKRDQTKSPVRTCKTQNLSS